MRTLARVAGCAALGLVFGSLLWGLAFLAAGLGHGCYVPFGVFAAPFGFAEGLLGSEFVLWVGTPLLWTGLGALFGMSGALGRAASWGRGLLALHYLCAAAVVSPWPGTAYSDWANFRRAPAFVLIALCVYGLGQAALWRLLPKLDRA